MKKIKSVTSILFVAMLVLNSCKKDEPEIIINEEEVITTLTYTLTPDDGGDDVVLSFKDLDGDGGNAPIITDGILDTNQVYMGNLVLLNEQGSAAEDITVEIQEEGTDHQFFFQTDIFPLTGTYEDQDANGDPIGIESSIITESTGSGTLTITLRHEPNKSAFGVAEGDITNAGGETDIEVTFNITIQ